MCLRGSPISTHGNYARCSNTETKLARQGVIVGCWLGSALPCGWGLSGGGLETHIVCSFCHTARVVILAGWWVGFKGDCFSDHVCDITLSLLCGALYGETDRMMLFLHPEGRVQVYFLCCFYIFLSFQVVLLATAWLCRLEHHSIWALGSEKQSCCVGNSPAPPMLADLLTLGNTGIAVVYFLLWVCEFNLHVPTWCVKTKPNPELMEKSLKTI